MIKQKGIEYDKLKESHQHELKMVMEDLRMQYEYKLRELERTVARKYTHETKTLKDKDENYKREITNLKQEVNLLQKQRFILRIKAMGRLMI